MSFPIPACTKVVGPLRCYPLACKWKNKIFRCFSTQNGPLSLIEIAKSVHEQINRTDCLTSDHVRVVRSRVFEDDLFLQLAAKQVGLSASDDLLKLPPQCKAVRLPNVVPSTRIVYQEALGNFKDRHDNDIWLGASRVKAFISLGLNYKFKQVFGSLELPENEAEAEDYTIFMYPYMRGTSGIILEALAVHEKSLGILDTCSLVYTAACTGSTRLFRFLWKHLHGNYVHLGSEASELDASSSSSAIHSVEEHAWPWMQDAKVTSNCEDLARIPLVLDSLCAAAIVSFTFQREHVIFDKLSEQLKVLEATARKISEEQTEGSDKIISSNALLPPSDDATTVEMDEKTIERIRRVDNAVLTRVVQLLILKRNLEHLKNDHIRVFSDFICDRLHRIDARSVANIAFALGHSKHLDEFWMFMMAKHIQSNFSDFGSDETTAILDAYSSASLEDVNFYNDACTQIKESFSTYTPKHLAVILRALSRVRVVDVELLESSMKVMREYADAHLNVRDKTNAKDCAYVVATALVSASDLDYRGGDLDDLWLLLSNLVRAASLDVSVLNWLPIAALNLPTRISLQTFLPVWLRHVKYTLNKLKSKTMVETIKRRHLLLLHALDLGIIPTGILPTAAVDALQYICKGNLANLPNAYVPESSTFHLEVCACLRALEVSHQREINTVPFVMDVVIPASKFEGVVNCDENRHAIEHRESGGFNLAYTRHSKNHRRKKVEVYIGHG